MAATRLPDTSSGHGDYRLVYKGSGSDLLPAVERTAQNPNKPLPHFGHVEGYGMARTGEGYARVTLRKSGSIAGILVVWSHFRVILYLLGWKGKSIAHRLPEAFPGSFNDFLSCPCSQKIVPALPFQDKFLRPF